MEPRHASINPQDGPASPARAGLRPMLTVAAAFVAAHGVFYLLGVRFDRDAVEHLMQFLDPELLRTRLAESLWYLHIQPPLMNLFTGLVLKLTPESPGLFQGVFVATGLGFSLALLSLQVELGVRRWWAAGLTVAFASSPSFVLLEHFLLYTFPCAALLTLSALLLLRFLRGGGAGYAAGFFGCLFLLCGMRSLFHLGWFVLVYGAVVVLSRGRRRTVVLAGLVPLLLVTAMYGKNLAVFGEFTVCTFVEKNLWINTVGNLGDEKDVLVAEGVLSPCSGVNRWASLDAYAEEYRVVPERFAGVAALSRTHQSNGDVNYNHYGYIAQSDAYGRDARWALRHRPKAFVYAVALSGYRYFVPASALPVSPSNQAALAPVIAAYDHGVFGKLPASWPFVEAVRARTGHAPHLLLLVGLPLAWCAGAWRGGAGLDRAARIVLAYGCFNIAMVFVLGCVFDFHEAARYRFLTDGFSLALLGLALCRRGERVA